MIDKEMFLNLVQNHHHKGDYTDHQGNFCLLGACAVATNTWSETQHCPIGGDKDYFRLKEKLEQQIKDFTNNKLDRIPDFNDSSASHEDIMLVAKKTVAELDSE